MLTFDIDGISIPKLGFGTYMLEGAKGRTAVAKAIEVGYRHIDTAAVYENEDAVGQGIRDSGIARDNIFVTTKIWTTDIAAGRHVAAMDESLERLGMDQVDLLLLHWPVGDMPVADQIAPLADIKQSGRAKLVGISNYPLKHCEEAVAASAVPLSVHQCEYHPQLDQTPILDFARRHGMLFTSYSPLGQGTITDNPVIGKIGEKYGKSAVQVILRWHMQQDSVSAIPKATGEDHIRQNFDIFDFELSQGDMDALFGLQKPDGRIVVPGWGPTFDTGIG